MADRLHVVVAGGGIAAAEFVLATHELAPDRVEVTLVSPESELVMRPLRTGEPFSRVHVSRYPLSALAGETGATVVEDRVAAVEPGAQKVELGSGGLLDYDVLVLAAGARSVDAYRKALTFRGDRRAIAYNGLLSDIEQGYTTSVAFVVPPGSTWPLPLYELALMTAREAQTMGVAPDLTLLTPEQRPLDVFGQAASSAVGDLLTRAGIAFFGDVEVSEADDGTLVTAGGRSLTQQRVVAVPVLEGIRFPGVPADTDGFIPVDGNCRVRGLANAFAAGDGSGNPVKQGGIACQQADTIAEQIAVIAGVDIEPAPFRPVLRGRLLTGSSMRYISDQDQYAGEPEQPVLFAAPRKVDGRYLSRWLRRLDGHSGEDEHADQAGGEAADLTVEVETPNA